MITLYKYVVLRERLAIRFAAQSFPKFVACNPCGLSVSGADRTRYESCSLYYQVKGRASGSGYASRRCLLAPPSLRASASVQLHLRLRQPPVLYPHIKSSYSVVVIKNNVLSKVSLPQGFGYSSGSCAFAFAAAAAGLAGFGFAALCYLIYCVVIIKETVLVVS